MKRKGWKRRAFSILLAVAMVLGSIDVTSFVTLAAENKETEAAIVPATPVGLVVEYWTNEDANQGKIRVAWGVAAGGGTPTSWKISVDGTEVGTATGGDFFCENVYAAGTHTVSVVAINDAGSSDAAETTFTLEQTQAGTTGSSGEGGTGTGSEGGSGNEGGTGSESGSGKEAAEGEVIVASGADLTGIVADGNQAEVNGWRAWTDKGVQANGGVDTVTFTFPAEKVGYDYALQFQQPDGSVTLTQGEYYTLTFTAESSIARFIEVCLGGSNNARHNDMVYKLPAGQATTITYVFAAESGEASKIQFLLGRQQSAGKFGEDLSADWAKGHTLTISGVSLVKAGSAELAGANSSAATDKTALNAMIAECSALNAGDYTADSYKVLTDAVTEAQKVADKADACVMDVDSTLTDMQIAKGNLVDAGYVPPSDPVASTGALILEDVIGNTYKSDSWGGDQNVQFKFNGTELVVTADSFGNAGSWAVQLQEVNVTSTEENNVFEFDVVSTIDKNIVWKNENSQEMETIVLKANVPVHIARRIAGKALKSTFDVSGGGAGTLTISNMKFGPEVSYYNFEEAVAAGDGTFQFYVGNEDWAGYAQATGTASGTTYTMDVTDFGSDDWGLQMILKGLVDVKTGDKYEIHAVMESSVDKTVTVKLGEVGNDSRALALKTYELKAGSPLDIALTSDKATEDFLGTLYFACGNAKGAKGTIKVSNVYVSKAGAGVAAEVPVLGTSKALDKANGFKVGEDIVVTFPMESADWANAITSLKVSNRALTKDTDYTVNAAAGTITIKAATFTKQNVYTIAIEADGYKKTEIKIPVYDADVANENWEVKWEDQFNGTELDTTKWSYEIGVKSGDDATSDAPIYWGNNEKQYYIKEAVQVKDGYLVITGNKLTDDVKKQYGVTDSAVQYTSGRIRTVTDDGKVLEATTYGRIEAKMSLPGYQGYWPAFWMLPATDVYGVWASSGELDIMEAVGQTPGQVNGTIHYGGQWPNNVYSGGVYSFPEGSDINSEHVYAVEWEPGEIRWYVDNVLYHIETNWYGLDANGEKFTYPAPFDEDFYILFNLAMSGNYVSNVLPKDDEMGKQMKVDYVKVMMDKNTDYNTEVTAPTVDRDTASFTEYGGYVDLIKDKDFKTLPDHKYGDGGNLLPGNDLWWSAVNTGAGAEAAVEVVGGAAKINVTKKGGNDYNVQLIQNIPIAKGYTYRVTFDAKTDVSAGRTIRVAPGGDKNHGWKSYDAGITPALTTEMKTYSFDFTMNSDSDPSVRLEMNIGGALGTVYIDNVSVIALTDEQLNGSDENGPKEPLETGEHIYNGTFDKGTGKLGYWTTEGVKGSTDNRNYTVTVGTEGAKLIQTGLQLRADDEYKLTFDASTLGTGKVRITLTDESGATVYATDDYNLTTSAESYALGFTVPQDKGTDMGKLVVEFIGNGETVTIDNVSMKRLTDVQMEWDKYELKPIAEGDTSGYSVYDEIWNWAENAITPTNIGGGETAFAIKTASAGENWKVLFQRKNVNIVKGMTYRIKYAIKSTVADSPVEVKIEDTSYSPCYDANLFVGTDWTYVDTTFTSTLTAAGDLKFCLAGVDSERMIYVKDISIEMEGVPVPQFAEGKEISTMKAGTTTQLDIEYNVKVQEKYKDFTYKSSDSGVAAVATDGTLMAKAEGTATITVTSVLGTEFTFDVTVTKAATHTHTGGKATCTSKATCSICGESYGSVDKNNHAGGTEIRNAKEATYTAEGYTGDTYCKGCNAKIATGKTIPKKAHTHTGGKATCTSKAKCSICGESYGSVDKNNHVGGTEVRNAVAATATKDGYTGDTYCKGCGAKIKTGTVIPKTGSGDNDKAPVQNGWYEKNGSKYWYENGEKQGTEGRGKEIYDKATDAWYWLDAPDGVMAKSKDVYQESLAGDWGDYFNENGERCGKWVRYDENGHMVKGWQDTENGRYFFDYTYGTMAKGYATIDGVEYYFNPATGVLEQTIGEVPENGWKTIDGRDYWYENYIRQGYSVDASYRGKEIYDNATDAWYWLDNIQGGAKAVSKDVYQESLAGDWGDYTNENGERCGKWVRYDENGHMIKGWQETENGTYFFDYTYGTMAKGDANIEGADYYFDPATGIRQ